MAAEAVVDPGPVAAVEAVAVGLVCCVARSIVGAHLGALAAPSLAAVAVPLFSVDSSVTSQPSLRHSFDALPLRDSYGYPQAS